MANDDEKVAGISIGIGADLELLKATLEEAKNSVVAAVAKMEGHDVEIKAHAVIDDAQIKSARTALRQSVADMVKSGIKIPVGFDLKITDKTITDIEAAVKKAGTPQIDVDLNVGNAKDVADKIRKSLGTEPVFASIRGEWVGWKGDVFPTAPINIVGRWTGKWEEGHEPPADFGGGGGGVGGGGGGGGGTRPRKRPSGPAPTGSTAAESTPAKKRAEQRQAAEETGEAVAKATQQTPVKTEPSKKQETKQRTQAETTRPTQRAAATNARSVAERRAAILDQADEDPAVAAMARAMAAAGIQERAAPQEGIPDYNRVAAEAMFEGNAGAVPAFGGQARLPIEQSERYTQGGKPVVECNRCHRLIGRQGWASHVKWHAQQDRKASIQSEQIGRSTQAQVNLHTRGVTRGDEERREEIARYEFDRGMNSQEFTEEEDRANQEAWALVDAAIEAGAESYSLMRKAQLKPTKGRAASLGAFLSTEGGRKLRGWLQEGVATRRAAGAPVTAGPPEDRASRAEEAGFGLRAALLRAAGVKGVPRNLVVEPNPTYRARGPVINPAAGERYEANLFLAEQEAQQREDRLKTNLAPYQKEVTDAEGNVHIEYELSPRITPLRSRMAAALAMPTEQERKLLLDESGRPVLSSAGERQYRMVETGKSTPARRLGIAYALSGTPTNAAELQPDLFSQLPEELQEPSEGIFDVANALRRTFTERQTKSGEWVARDARAAKRGARSYMKLLRQRFDPGKRGGGIGARDISEYTPQRDIATLETRAMIERLLAEQRGTSGYERKLAEADERRKATLEERANEPPNMQRPTAAEARQREKIQSAAGRAERISRELFARRRERGETPLEIIGPKIEFPAAEGPLSAEDTAAARLAASVEVNPEDEIKICGGCGARVPASQMNEHFSSPEHRLAAMSGNIPLGPVRQYAGQGYNLGFEGATPPGRFNVPGGVGGARPFASKQVTCDTCGWSGPEGVYNMHLALPKHKQAEAGGGDERPITQEGAEKKAHLSKAHQRAAEVVEREKQRIARDAKRISDEAEAARAQVEATAAAGTVEFDNGAIEVPAKKKRRPRSRQPVLRDITVEDLTPEERAKFESANAELVQINKAEGTNYAPFTPTEIRQHFAAKAKNIKGAAVAAPQEAVKITEPIAEPATASTQAEPDYTCAVCGTTVRDRKTHEKTAKHRRNAAQANPAIGQAASPLNVEDLAKLAANNPKVAAQIAADPALQSAVNASTPPANAPSARQRSGGAAPPGGGGTPPPTGGNPVWCMACKRWVEADRWEAHAKTATHLTNVGRLQRRTGVSPAANAIPTGPSGGSAGPLAAANAPSGAATGVAASAAPPPAVPNLSFSRSALRARLGEDVMDQLRQNSEDAAQKSIEASEDIRQSGAAVLKENPVRALSVAVGQILVQTVGGRAKLEEQVKDLSRYVGREQKLIKREQSARNDYAATRLALHKARQDGDEDEVASLEEDVKARRAIYQRARKATQDQTARVSAKSEEIQSERFSMGLRTLGVGTVGIVGGTALFNAAMTAFNTAMQLGAEWVGRVTDQMSGFAEEANKLASSLGQAALPTGRVQSVISSQLAQAGIGGTVGERIASNIGPRVTGEMATRRLEQARDTLALNAQSLRDRALHPEIQNYAGVYQPTGGMVLPLIGQTNIGAQASVQETLAGMLGDQASNSPFDILTGQTPWQQDFRGAIARAFGNLGPGREIEAQRQAAADTLATLNQYIERGGGTAQFRNETTQPTLGGGEAKELQAQALKDQGASPDFVNRIRSGDALITDANGRIITSAKELAAAFDALTQGMKPSLDQMLNVMKRSLEGQFYSIRQGARRQIEEVNPIARMQAQAMNPIQPFGTGLFPSVMGMPNFAGAPPGVMEGFAQYGAQSMGIEKQIRDQAQAGWDQFVKQVRSSPVIDNPDQVIGQMQQVRSIGEDIAGMQRSLAGQQVSLQWEQYNTQVSRAKRNISDLTALVKGASAADASHLGILERQNLELSRQSEALSRRGQALSLDLNQRQINMQLALAGFQAPGQTPGEAAAQRRQAELEAQYAQQQQDIAKEQFGLAGQMQQNQYKIVDESNLRALQDAIKDLDIFEKGTKLDNQAKALEKLTTDAQALQQSIMQDIAVQTSSMQAAHSAMDQTTAQIFQDGSDNLRDVARAVEKTFTEVGATWRKNMGLPPLQTTSQAEPNTGGEQPQSGIGGKATGFIGSISTPTSVTVGEAGSEQVAILRNPRTLLTPTGGGNGGNTINININNPVVREDQDIDAIALAVERSLNRRASLLLR